MRSIEFQNNILSIGSAFGRLSFYDLVADKILDLGSDEKNGEMAEISKPYLSLSGGWLEHSFREHRHLSRQQACYTMNYSPGGKRLFCGGGPLLLHFRGGYAGLW